MLTVLWFLSYWLRLIYLGLASAKESLNSTWVCCSREIWLGHPAVAGVAMNWH